jgi:hypothetical protein
MGKSTAALAVLGRCRNLVVVDFARKGQFDHLGVVSEDPDAILRHPVVIFQPPPGAVARPAKDWSDPWSTALWYVRTVRARRGVCVYHDEARRTLSTRPHPLAAEMVDMGMGQGVSVWVATQGFSGVYPPVFDNAVHWVCFRLASASQRGSLAASLEVDGLADRLAKLPPRVFLYWRQGMVNASGPHPLAALGGRRSSSAPAAAGPVFDPTNGTALNSDGATARIEPGALTSAPGVV